MNHTVKSLVYVVETGTQALREYAGALESAKRGDRRVAPILKAITTEADVLSGALSRLSNHVEKLPESKSSGTHGRPPLDADLLDWSQKLFSAIESGFCSRCGGVKRPE